MRFFLTICILLSLGITDSNAQQPKKLNSVEIYNALEKLNFLGSVLYIAAHPDDENTRLISYLANQQNARTAYLSLTRGDGGQNLIGPEIRELLGVIRTQELLAARRIDGGEQLFTRANDFGYSKHPDETLEIWNKEDVLSDVVWAIRKFKPDVIINRFDHRSPGSTHGHHTSSAMLSVEAYELAADSKAFSDQLKYTKTWQPARQFFNTSWWFYGSREKFDKADKKGLMSLDTGTYYPETGLSNTEIAALSRSQHKSQGFGSTGTRGETLEYIELINGTMPTKKESIFEGIDTTWNRIKGGKPLYQLLTTVQQEFDFNHPEKSVPKLLEAFDLIKKLEDEHWRTIKLDEITEIIVAASGLYLEAVTDNHFVTPGSSLKIEIEAINRSKQPIYLEKVTLAPTTLKITDGINLENNKSNTFTSEITLPKNSLSTNPYWLNKQGTLGMYNVEDRQLIGQPETLKNLRANFSVKIGEHSLVIAREIVFKKNDPVQGEVYQPLEVVPKVAVSLNEKVVIYNNNNSQEIRVNLLPQQDNLSGTLQLETPQDWTVEPNNYSFNNTQKGQVQEFSFKLSPPANQSEGLIQPVATVNEKKYDKELISITYDHIPNQTVILPAKTKVVRLDIQRKGQNIGYIEGAGDVVPQSLAQVGYTVTTIAPNDISANNLSKFDAIVMGIRAYNIVEELKFKQDVLLDYVKNGGNLIVQYNTNRGLKVNGNLGPYPINVSRDRVTDENAKVTFIDPKHPVLNYPNKITPDDFEGWVQERGLYFPDEWSKEYSPILAINDKGESSKKGSLLVTPYGKGNYIYTGLSFFREFPAGVSGAYRLFANLISLGK
ncbi:PIG-L family deacetylase [Aquimarina intermedia]|uniref:LmbE family N-acetylglucosaminyl deacetylase n=1 Tax=Aquimarina intermedia TaxID=350814 RepID=A0A5S5C937_9FLAO|nr:PIG-L family deacetylase [Aquimarina intermedia]TYP75128.1 LmbE family N-acetylglucosaminyl deacetylase [Aquimarina intermedia]